MFQGQRFCAFSVFLGAPECHRQEARLAWSPLPSAVLNTPVCPLLSRRVVNCPVLSCLAQSHRIQSRPVVSCSIISKLVLFFWVLSCAVLSWHVQPCPVMSCAVLVDTASGTATAAASEQVSNQELNGICIRIEHLSSPTS